MIMYSFRFNLGFKNIKFKAIHDRSQNDKLFYDAPQSYRTLIRIQ